MIKGIVSGPTKEERVNEYPCIKEMAGLIVLFYRPNSGVVLSPRDGFEKIGDCYNGWNEQNFKLFQGEVVLRNA